MRSFLIIGMAILLPSLVSAADNQPELRVLLSDSCFDCHNSETSNGKLDLTSLSEDISRREIRDRWVQIHDRINNNEMPPAGNELSAKQRATFLKSLKQQLHRSDLTDVISNGRGPIRRLNRDEYQQNLRDVLKLPHLDIRDILPEDRVSHHFNKTAEVLDISRVQMNAYLDAAEAALLEAIASGTSPPAKTKFKAIGRQLFNSTSTFGNREAMFFARDSKALSNEALAKTPKDTKVEVAVFRSAHWPYFGYPQTFTAKRAGRYRVKFSARAVLQQKPHAVHIKPCREQSRRND